MRHLVIAGGGIGGLALGIAARRRGLGATVLERAVQPTDTGSGLVLSPNGMKALADLGAEVAADVRAAGSASGPGHHSAFVTSTGRPLSTMTFSAVSDRWGAPVVSLRRSRLHGVLLDHAHRHGVEVRTGVTVDGYREHDARITAGGVEGDILVGCDGLRSAVRRQLLGDGDPQYLGYTAVRGIGPAPARFPYGFLGYGRGLILFAAAVDDGQLYWVASIAAPPGEWAAKDVRSAHADVLALVKDWAPDLTAPVRGADPSLLVLTDLYDRDPVTSWSRGRATLLGDAAHPMSYTMGQGANLTLEDAITLAYHLAEESNPERAFAAYEQARVDRTAKIVKMSRMFGRVGHVRHPLAVWARDRMMSLMGLLSRFGDPDRSDAELYGWEPPAGQPAPRLRS